MHVSWTRRTAGWRSACRAFLAVAVAGMALAPTAARGQSAIIYGSLSNFDISNDTGQVCHGFEVDLEGVTPDQVPYGFTSTRYGTPSIVPTPAGTKVRWASAYDGSTNTWATRTVQHTVPWFPGQCYMWVPGTYENGGCEHFGTWTTGNPTKVSSRWLCEDSSKPGTLTPMDPPTAVPYASYYVAQPAVAGGAPQLVAEVEAPDPPDAPELHGDAQWERTYVMELPRSLTVDELVADNPAAVPMDLDQLESDYDLLQAEPASGGGGGDRARHGHEGNISPTTRAIVRRIELWSYTGTYDPVTHEALCLDPECKVADPSEIGELISVQMTAANVEPDSVVVTRVGGGRVLSADTLIGCGSNCAASYNAGDVVTLTARADSGFVFSGWNGACAGTGTCTVTVNGITTVGATFTVAPSGGSTPKLVVKTSGKGTVVSSPAGINCGLTCAARVASGSVMELTATPSAGFRFANWSGACTGTSATCTVTVTRDATAQANFVKQR